MTVKIMAIARNTRAAKTEHTGPRPEQGDS